MNRPHFLARAQTELEDSAVWYEKQGTGLGDRFLDEFQKKLDLVLESPEIFPLKKKKYREAVLKNFPFSIIFEFDREEKAIIIISVFHNSRNPKKKFKQRKN